MPIRFASSMILLVTVLTGCGDLDHGGTGPADPADPTATGTAQVDAGALPSPDMPDAAVAHDSSSPATDAVAPPTQDAARPPLPPPPPPDPGEEKKGGPGKH